MLLTIIKNILIVFVFSVIQISAIPFLDKPLFFINLILLFLIFTVFIMNVRKAATYALIFGLISDLFSGLFFPAITICLLLTIYSVNFFALHFLTNKSIYSISLITVITLIIYNLLYSLMMFINNLFKYNSLNFFNFFNQTLLIHLLQQMVVNVILIIIVYLISYKLSNKLQTVLIKK